jgi:hypothetical protein
MIPSILIIAFVGTMYFFYDTIQEFINGGKSIAPAETKGF